MQFKHKLVAASVAMAVSGGAHAALGDVQVFVGGATAPQNFYREDIVQRICDPAAAPVRVFTDNVDVLPEETPGGNILQTADHQVVHCTARNTFTGNATDLNGQDIAIYKYNGGSSTGVAPVSDPASASPGNITYLDATLTGVDACAPVLNSGGTNAWPIGNTADTYELYDCPDSLEVVQIPDAGVSDVEPTLFVGPLALSFGQEPTGVADRPTQPFEDKSNLVVRPGPGLMFGVAVSLPMYDEMIKDQVASGILPASCDPTTASRADLDAIACMPWFPRQLVRDVAGGRVTSWDQVNIYGGTLDPAAVPEGNNVHYCKRTNGSGTHAQFSVHFLDTNCSATNQFASAEQNDGIAFAPAGLVGVYGNSGSSDMNDCLDALGNGEGFNGDFSILPPDNAANGTNGDSTVVMGTDLPAILNPNDPLGRNYNTEIKAYGMGYNSMENNGALEFDYRFVKVDGVEPTLERAVDGTYKDVYYTSWQYRVDGGGEPDLQTGAIRTAAATQAQKDVAEAYFSIWTAISPAAVNAVNRGLIVDPDGVADSGDEWETGYVTPAAGASMAFTSGNPATPWTRQDPLGGADSCQDLSLVK